MDDASLSTVIVGAGPAGAGLALLLSTPNDAGAYRRPGPSDAAELCARFRARRREAVLDT